MAIIGSLAFENCHSKGNETWMNPDSWCCPGPFKRGEKLTHTHPLSKSTRGGGGGGKLKYETGSVFLYPWISPSIHIVYIIP